MSRGLGDVYKRQLESTPPELAADVAKNGILLTGGGSMLRGLAGYIAAELHVDVAIAPDPINCVARGTAASLTLGQYLTPVSAMPPPERGITDCNPQKVFPIRAQLLCRL